MSLSVSTLIIEILADKFGIAPEDVSPSTLFDDLAVDSLALLEMALVLEKRLGVAIPEGMLKGQQSIEEAAQAVDALKGPAAARPTEA